MGSTKQSWAYGATFEAFDHRQQTPEAAYEEATAGAYTIVTQWRLNSGNFEQEQDGQIKLYALCKGSKMMEHGICYSPTWTTFKPPYKNNGPNAQFSDVDFFNVAFEGLWKSRGDLRALGGTGFTLLRLYNWGPTRGWNGSVGDAHLPFLDHAKERGLKVIVPVSNYFLSSDQYAWGADGRPNSDYSFGSAPNLIQTALVNFVSSVTRSDKLHPAVHSFSVGNEIDYNTMKDQGGPAVEPSVRLARALWWIVNLQAQLAKMGAKAPLTIVISNADQGNDPPPNQNKLYPYWFQAFVNGVQAGETYPKGTVVDPPGSTTAFVNACKGLSAFDWYKDWFYNSVCIYQYGEGLKATLRQYDKWKKGSENSTNWPGQQFEVPLLLTEIGVRHRPPDSFPTDDQTFIQITRDIAEAIRDYYNSASRLMGYCLYSFNDEVWLDPKVGANWGIFRNGPVAEQKSTGTTRVSYGTFPTVNYPVEKLTSLRSAKGVRVIDRLSEIFSGDAGRLYIANYGSTALAKLVRSEGGKDFKVAVGPTSFATVNTKDVTGALPWHIMNSPTLTAATINSLPAIAAFAPNVLTAYPYLTAVAYPCGMIC